MGKTIDIGYWGTDMDSKRLTINNIEKLDGMYIGPVHIRHFYTTDDYYIFDGVGAGIIHFIRIYRRMENPDLGIVKVVVIRCPLGSPKEKISVVHHISLLEDRSEWSRKMGSFMNNMVWEQK